MRGDQHVLINLLTAGTAISPWITVMPPGWLLIILAGVFAGSLAPDADAPGSAIMRGLRPGRGAYRGLARHTVLVLPLIGYTIRYLIYYPVSAVVWLLSLGRVTPRHRGLLHSFCGAITTSALFTVYLAAVVGILAHSAPFASLAVFGTAFLVGCLLHLLGDSATRSGVAWWLPFSSRRIAGRVTTGSRRDPRPDLLAMVLGASMLLLLVAARVPETHAPVAEFAAPAVAVVAWAFFLALSGVRVESPTG